MENEVNEMNLDFEDHLATIEPSFVCRRPKLLMLWFQLVQWNSSQTITQGIFFSASGLGCYAHVRGPVVIALGMIIACVSLIVMGYTVLPTYALMLHCGEHLRPKGKTHKHRKADKEHLHRNSSFKALARGGLLQHRTSTALAMGGVPLSPHSAGDAESKALLLTPSSTVAGVAGQEEEVEMTTTGGSVSSKYVVEAEAVEEAV